MKLLAMRFGEDDDDIRILLRQTRVRSPDEALALLAQMYPHREAPPRTRLFLEEILRSDGVAAVAAGPAYGQPEQRLPRRAVAT